MIDLILAQAAVTDIEASERWYQSVFGSPPDTRPMDGLIEWRFASTHGVQIFRDAERAGASTAVVGLSDFDDVVARLYGDGIDHSKIQPGGGGRLLTLADPDGNQVVLLDADAAAGDHAAAAAMPQTTMRFERRIAAPVEQVWGAYADLDRRAVWSVPEGEAVIYDASDFTPGGVDEYRCGPPDDLASHVTTRYHQIDAPHLHVASNEIRRNGEAMAVDLSQWVLRSDGESTIVTIIVQVTSLVGDEMLDGYRNGHERTLDHLEKYL